MTPLEILEFYEGSIEREEGKEPCVTINADDYAAVLTGFREAVEERDRYKAALEQFATNELSSRNCASVELAARRVRLIARRALTERSKP